MSMLPAPPARPRLRGVVHHYAFFVSLLCGAALIAAVPHARVRWPTAVFVASLSGLLGVSALFHRVTWSAEARRWMGRLDHAMIGVLIAGTYTPFGTLVGTGVVAASMVKVVWMGALGSAALHLLWIDAPKPLSAACYVLLGWAGVAGTPDLLRSFGWVPPFLLGVGGIVYSLGALVYARRTPDPRPDVFGYHEVFHTLVVVGAAFHFAAVAAAVLPLNG